MRAPNKKRKPKHSIKIGHNTGYIYAHYYWGQIFSTKRISCKAFMCYKSWKFDVSKCKTIKITERA